MIHPVPDFLGIASGLYSLAELSSTQVLRLATRSVQLFRNRCAHDRPLAGKMVGILFTKTSTRTRTSFTVGALHLGGHPVTYGPHDLQLNTGESLLDTGRVLGSMLDILVVRTAGPIKELRALSQYGQVPVVNAMAAEEHPTQGLCDLATLSLHLGDLVGIRLLYVGEGNNTAVALGYALSAIPKAQVTFATPTGYGLTEQDLNRADERGATVGASIRQVHDLAQLPDAVDVVYTSRWQTTGTSKSDPAWREAFRPYYVDKALMSRWPQAVFMHDLPAHRGDEVSGTVLDGPGSIAWLQAEMKLAAAMTVLEWVADCSITAAK